MISIGGRVHIPLTAKRARTAASSRAVSRTARSVPRRARHSRQLRTAEISGPGKVSTGTTVQIEPIYVVIPLRVDRCPSAACQPRCAYELYRTEPAYPPEPDRVVPPRSPPRRGGITKPGSTLFVCLRQTPPNLVSSHCGGRPPTPRLSAQAGPIAEPATGSGPLTRTRAAGLRMVRAAPECRTS